MIGTETMTGLLRVLQSCGGIPVRESVIFAQFNGVTVTVQPMHVIREHLQHAKDKGWVDYIVDEIDRVKKWFITPEGKVLLAGR